MKKAFYSVVIPLLLLISVSGNAQSNKGTEFWTAFMSHNAGVDNPNTGAMMVLYITSDISTTGSVEIGGSLLQNFTVTANQVTFVDIPTSAFLEHAGTFPNGGIHITSAKPIAVYAHIYAFNVSGATLLLPVSAMGKEYMSLNYTQLSNAPSTAPAYSSFAIIATEDNTTVAVTPPSNLLDGHLANTTFNITLNKGEVYQGLAETDLTGTQIQSISNNAGSCKKIAVFSGSTRMGIGCVNNGRNFSSDNLFQQVYPTSTWGKNYVAAPLRSRPYDVFRIILSDPNTTVTLNGKTIDPANFTNGLYYQFESTRENIISADKPIQVVQYSPSQNQQLDCTVGTGDVGDPEMIYLSPVEQGLTHVTLYATGYYRILQSYVNVVMPSSAVSTFKVDGISYASSFIPIPNSSYSYAQISVSSGPQTDNNGAGSVTAGTHTLDAAVPFNAIVYGFGSTESYGYAAGTNLADLNEHVTIADANNPTVTQTTTGCSNITYKAQVTIPFQTTNINWKIDGATVYSDNNPVVKSITVKDNKQLYLYEYNAPVNFIAGNHTIIATVFNPVADVCGSNQDIQNDFSISDPPPVSFIAPDEDCLGDSTAFKDNTVLTTGESITSWLWDFGDNTTSALQNPLHKYAAAGHYNVHLTEIDNNGCTNISAPKTVHIIARPVAAFNIPTPDCSGQLVTFSNTSRATEGTITKWTWDFGDSTIVNATTGKNQTHKYTNAGDYNVKLYVTTDAGCTSDTLTQVLTVHPLPVVDFTVPDVCLADGFAGFTDNSTISDNTEADFNYLWDFGDSRSTSANNQSALKNPRHAYTTVGLYTVKLTVTSKYGCSTTLQKSFTVNGSNPKADFAVENNCSGEDIVFDDKSTIDAYNITRIVWYFDYDRHPEIYETYIGSAIHSNKKYLHRYTFNTPPTQTYNVRMDVYSGQTCVNTIYKEVVINANPVVSLSANNNLIKTSNTKPDTVTMCYSDLPLQIVEDKGSYTGVGAFTGPGISTDGLIDPQKAGAGIFTINYLFTASATGCTYVATFVLKVSPAPTISLQQHFAVLEGNQITLRAIAGIAGGGNLTYKWTPSTGLSADNIPDPVATLSADTKYTLTVTSGTGCPTSTETFVKVLKMPLIPNAFTPNGDGINDTWEIKYLNDYPNATVEILSRYGGRVYYSNGYGTPWDGRSNGANLPVGTYYYIISPNSGRKPTSGYLTIIR
ncbi:PKD domain-containing protein [Mucilaginibacter panaciglaebae]|uniref:PKD domain-containing protein n=1 Tax=Mucilaginibacter panaciglaebae TaxID=502331 RepID=A0ABP7WCB0_9SPHI